MLILQNLINIVQKYHIEYTDYILFFYLASFANQYSNIIYNSCQSRNDSLPSKSYFTAFTLGFSLFSLFVWGAQIHLPHTSIFYAFIFRILSYFSTQSLEDTFALSHESHPALYNIIIIPTLSYILLSFPHLLTNRVTILLLISSSFHALRDIISSTFFSTPNTSQINSSLGLSNYRSNLSAALTLLYINRFSLIQSELSIILPSAIIGEALHNMLNPEIKNYHHINQEITERSSFKFF